MAVTYILKRPTTGRDPADVFGELVRGKADPGSDPPVAICDGKVYAQALSNPTFARRLKNADRAGYLVIEELEGEAPEGAYVLQVEKKAVSATRIAGEHEIVIASFAAPEEKKRGRPKKKEA